MTMVSLKSINLLNLTINHKAMNFKNIFWGVILIVIGSLFLVEELTAFDFGRFFWPIILIVTGGLLLLRNFVNSDSTNRSNI